MCFLFPTFLNTSMLPAMRPSSSLLYEPGPEQGIPQGRELFTFVTSAASHMMRTLQRPRKSRPSKRAGQPSEISPQHDPQVGECVVPAPWVRMWRILIMDGFFLYLSGSLLKLRQPINSFYLPFSQGKERVPRLHLPFMCPLTYLMLLPKKVCFLNQPVSGRNTPMWTFN